MTFPVLILPLLAFGAVAPNAAKLSREKAKCSDVKGIVYGPDAKPAVGVKVQAGETHTRTDAEGRFQIWVSSGQTMVRFSAKGMEAQEREIQRGELMLVALQPMTAQGMVEVIEGSGYGTEDTSHSAMTRMEIYTTPGGAADVFQAAKTLPGVSNASEGAELFVRGGKPDEVGIFLNGGRLTQPFHHPSTQGGIFSSVDTAVVTSVNFIPGGFSARYGNALSAVMDLGADGALVRQGGTVVLNLASQGLVFDQPVGDGLARVSTRYANTSLLDRWYHLARNFEEAPISQDLHVAYQTPVGDAGRFSFMGLSAKDHLGVDLTLANFSGAYFSKSNTAFLSGTYTQALGEQILMNATVSRTGHEEQWTFGPWGMNQREQNLFHRLEMTFQSKGAWNLDCGLDGDRTRLSPKGSVPDDALNWESGAPSKAFAYAFPARRTGFYATTRWRFTDAWGLSLGGRTDDYGILNERTWDWRGTLSWRASDAVTFRLAGGTFHQAPAMTALNPYVGNPNLQTMQASHAVLAIDAKGDQAEIPWQLRVEAYAKTYGRLPVKDSVLHWTSTGYGFAHGVDLLLKAAKAGWRGSLGYGFLHTKRKEDIQSREGNVPTSIPHTVTTMLGWAPKAGWEIAGTFRYASGAPFTPILGGIPEDKGFLPLKGAPFSERLPTYRRTDLRLTHLFASGPFRFVAFLEALNVFNHPNISSYAYSRDYAERMANPSYFARRILVAGVTISW